MGRASKKSPVKAYQATGEAGTEVAYPRIFYTGRLLSADDVLHYGGRLDVTLFYMTATGKLSGLSADAVADQFTRDAGRSRGHDVLDGTGGSHRCRHMCRWPAERSGACDEV